MALRRLILLIGITIFSLTGCVGAAGTPVIAPTPPLTPTPVAVPTTELTQSPTTPVGALPFSHTPCAKAVDLTGRTVSFYHLADAPDSLNVQGLPLRAGFDDAAEYFNAHGGLCGAALAQVFPDPVRGQYDPLAEYTRIAALVPKPPLIGLYYSNTAEALRDQLAKDEILALGPVGSILGLYGANGQSPGWVFATNPSYADQLGAFCRYVAQHPTQYPHPVIGYLTWVIDVGTVEAYVPEAIAFCSSLGVKVLDTPTYFSPETTFINTTVQNLIDAGANIIYTDSRGSGPALIARTLAGMGLQGTVTLAGQDWALDEQVGLLGEAAPGAGGLPSTNGLLGSLPLRSWAERDQPGIQFLAEQADRHQRPQAERNSFYTLGWVMTNLFIELYVETGNRVGFDHITGYTMKQTLENMVYSPLGGLVTIDYQHGARRDLAANRIGQMAYLGRDGKSAAGPNNQPLLISENGQQLMVPLLEPLTDFQAAPDLRPGGVDVPTHLLPTPTFTPIATAAQSGRLSVTGRFAFVSTRDGNAEIYAMNADGSGLARLTNKKANSYDPVWSPDGKKIAFVSDRDGNLEIYTMNADGSGQTNLTNNPAIDEQPAWSPDSTKIAFGSERDGHHKIYAMNADGSNVTLLTNHPAFNELPTWSPDGTKIAFTTDRDGNSEIYVMNADGTNPRRLTNNTAQDAFAQWSPDGTQIAFWTDRDGNPEIYVMNADGSGQTDLTNNPADDGDAAWLPGGKYISFRSNRDGRNQVYIMNADGSNPTRLTDDPVGAGGATWQP